MPGSTRRSFMSNLRTSWSLGAAMPFSWSTFRETQRPQLAVRRISFLGEGEEEEEEEKVRPPQ